MADSVIRTRGLTRDFEAVRAVDGVSLDIHRGRTLALLGPSGCGKTTMLRLIAGFERPDDGTVEIDDTTVAGHGVWVPPERRRVGMVFQDYALFPHLSVARNVGFGLPQARFGKGRERHRRIAEVLRLVGLDGLEDRYPSELSGGQQQRVALARALAPQPAVVLLDEPFSNLDAALRAQVRSEVHRILGEAEATAVFVTHDQEEALSVADEVAVMRDGRLVQVATPEELYRFPGDRAIAEFVGDAEFLPGRGSGQVVETELGRLPLERPMEGDVDVLLRPEHLRVERAHNGSALVLTREFYGHDQMLFVQLPTGRVVRVRLGPIADIAPGDRCTVSIPGPVRAYAAGR